MSSYKMPEVEPGMFVYWYPGGEKSRIPHTAIVTALGFDSLCLSIVDQNSHNLLIRDGVRHMDDPRARATEMFENGGWDYTKLHKRFEAMGFCLAATEKEVDGLQKQVKVLQDQFAKIGK